MKNRNYSPTQRYDWPLLPHLLCCLFWNTRKSGPRNPRSCHFYGIKDTTTHNCDTAFLCNWCEIIDVDLIEFDIRSQCRKFFYNWRDCSARRTPRSPKIYYNRFISIDLIIIIKIPFETVDDNIVATYDLAEFFNTSNCFDWHFQVCRMRSIRSRVKAGLRT